MVGSAVEAPVATSPPRDADAQPVAPTDDVDASNTGTLAYRPYLDGLRAVAVYLVVLFHAGSGWFSGGYIGVDVFFVLSGFLVTRLLLRDLVGLGTVRFSRFYARRYRRLLPAAFIVLVGTALVFRAVASPIEVEQAAGGFRASFLYVSNLWFIHDAAGYFGADLSGNPVLQFWSLAVEEQFYLVWPLLLGGLFLLTRRVPSQSRWRVMQLVVATAAVASVLWAWSLRSADPNRAYYGTDARAYELLAGALLALTPGLIARFPQRWARWASVAAVAALVFVATDVVDLDAIQRGTIVTGVTVVFIAALESARGGLAIRALSRSTMVYLGKISYGTYLWHWPVVLVLIRTFNPEPVASVALTAFVATALASLSFQIIENPVRISQFLDRHRRTVIAAGLTICIVAAVFIVPFLTTTPTGTAPTTEALSTTGFTPVPNLDWRTISVTFPRLPNCYGKAVDACILVHGTGPHIMVIGDSEAGMMIPAFEKLAREQGLTLSASTAGGCPWQRNLQINRTPIFGQTDLPEKCQAIREDAYDRVIPALDPDIVVGMNLGYEIRGQNLVVKYVGPNGESLPTSSPEMASWLEQTTTKAADELRAGGRKLVIIEPTPLIGKFDPVDCLSKASVVEQCRYVFANEPSDLEGYYRGLADGHNVWSLDLDRAVCPYLPICDPIINHMVVKMDADHLTGEFSESLTPLLQSYFRDNGILASNR